MHKAAMILGLIAIAAPAVAQDVPGEQTPTQRYNYWTRCIAMFDIVGEGQRIGGNAPEAEYFENLAKLGRTNQLKEVSALNMSRDDAEKDIATRVGQFKETLAGGDKAIEAQFGRAVDICAGSLNFGKN